MQWFEAEELAVAVLGYCDDDELDSDTIEQKIFEKFEISLEQFQKVAEALMPFTIPAQAAISGNSFNGFVKDGAFIVKAPEPLRGSNLNEVIDAAIAKKKSKTPGFPGVFDEAADLIEQQAAVIEQMREALAAMITYARAEGKGLRIADEALALQPCPEVLNKVRADAVRKFGNWVIVRAVGATNIPMTTGTVRSMSEDYAQRIEKGEA